MDGYAYKPLSAPLRLLLIAAGTVSLLVGLAAIFLPVLPTTEFIILAAFCYARSSESLHRWVTTRPYLRPYFAAAQRFKERREIPLRVKIMAVGMSWLSVMLMAAGVLSAPHWAKWTAGLIALSCTVFMLKMKTARAE
jgi:uncharacterized membrane protein YbaN (DUF454 family)